MNIGGQMPKIALRPELLALDAPEESVFESPPITPPDSNLFNEHLHWETNIEPGLHDSDFASRYSSESETEIQFVNRVTEFILTPIEKADKIYSLDSADVVDFEYLNPNYPNEESKFQPQNEEERQVWKTAQFSNSELNQPIFHGSSSTKTIQHIESIKPLLRRPEAGVVTAVRFDPKLSALHEAVPGIAKASDQNYFLLHLHHKYLTYAAKVLRWTSGLSYERLKQGLDDVCKAIDATLPHILTVTIYPQGTFTITAKPALERKNLLSGLFGHGIEKSGHDVLSRDVEKSPQHIYHLYWDTGFTTISFNTSFKTTFKEQYDRARLRSTQRVNERDLVDIVTFNSSYGVISGCDVCIAIYREDKWYTPVFSDGAMCDPMRYMLLAAGLIVEAPLRAYDIQRNEEVIVFNSSIGILRGIIMSEPPENPQKKRKRPNKPRTFERRSTSKIISDQRDAHLQSKMTERLPGKTQHKNKIPGTQILKF